MTNKKKYCPYLPFRLATPQCKKIQVSECMGNKCALWNENMKECSHRSIVFSIAEIRHMIDMERQGL